MHVTYDRLSKHSRTFTRISDLRIEDFNKLAAKLPPFFTRLEAQKLTHGPSSHLPTLQDKLGCVLMYYCTYVSHVFLGYVFNLHHSNICRLLKKWSHY